MANLTGRVKWVEGTLSIGQAGKHVVAIDRAASVGGTEAGFKASELLLVSVAGCFTSTITAVVKARDAVITELEVQAHGISAENPSRLIQIELAVTLAVIDSNGNALADEELDKLIILAERGCFVSNSIRAAVPIEVKRIATPTPALV